MEEHFFKKNEAMSDLNFCGGLRASFALRAKFKHLLTPHSAEFFQAIESINNKESFFNASSS